MAPPLPPPFLPPVPMSPSDSPARAPHLLHGRPLPPIVQGGMGIAVSGWRLARAVALEGHVGIVSGTGIDLVLVRELQNGDPHGRLRVLADYPDPAYVAWLRETYYIEGGKAAGAPYKLLPIHRFNPTLRSQQVLAAAAYSEIRLARDGHDGLIGLNLLAKIKRHTLGALVGAILADADLVVMGAGIPIEEAEALRRLADGEVARLRLDVEASEGAAGAGPFFYTLDPGAVVPGFAPRRAPAFFPIVSSDALAAILEKKIAPGAFAGFIVEHHTAGGHNAPPRNKGADADQNPVYDARDEANLTRIAALGYPFYVAGGYGTPEGLRRAWDAGAVGVQIGSLFSLCDESGYPEAQTRHLIRSIHRGEARIRTDGRASPTGFPFKVVEVDGTLGMPEAQAARTRICDLGYLQTAYLDDRGTVQGRCASEPVEDFVRKGGSAADTVRRACLCNGLAANIGLGQVQKWGEEGQFFTGGDDLVHLPLGSAEHPHYSARDVIEYLMAEPSAPGSSRDSSAALSGDGAVTPAVVPEA